MPSHHPPQVRPASTSASAAGESRSAIVVEQLSKTFELGAEPARTLKERMLAFRRPDSQQLHALSAVDFAVPEGRSFGILGHNGSGKSTLLKVMAGTIRPSSGRVRVRGRLSALLELGAGFHPDLTGRENVYLNASILGFPRSEVDGLFDEIIDFAELQDFVDLQVKFYSSGMTARLGFAVATHLEPDVLLVDEVLSVGDEAFQMKCMERVHRFRGMGRTMVIVSHAPDRVRELCDMALVLERGRMLHVGDVDTAVEIYRASLHDPSARAGKGLAGGAVGPAAPARQVTADTAVGSPAGVDRAGEKAVTIEWAEVVGVDDDIPFGPGESIKVHVRYTLHRPVDFRIRLALRAQDNMVMLNRSTSDALPGPLPDRPGPVDLRFTIQDLPLLDGIYRFAVVAETPDAAHVWDRIIPPEAEFQVKGPDPSFGRVDMDVGFELVADRQIDLIDRSEVRPSTV